MVLSKLLVCIFGRNPLYLFLLLKQILLIIQGVIGHFTVVYSVAWLLNGSEAEGDLALIQTSVFYYVNEN